jgi:hypothetical protein
MTIQTAKPAIVILSRGERLGPLYRGVARALSADHRVIVVMGWPGEATFWRDEPTEIVDLPVYQTRLAGTSESELQNRARAIEQEIGLPLYKAASNYLLYRRFNKAYFGTWPDFYNTERQLLEEFVASYDTLKPLLDLERPIAVLHEALDLIGSLVAFALCRQRRIFNLGYIFGPGVGDGQLVFYYGLRRQIPVFSHLMRNPHLILDKHRAEAEALLAGVDAGPIQTMTHIVAERARGSRSPMERLVRRLSAAMRPSVWKGLGPVLRAERNKRSLDRICHRHLPDDPFVLFMMHRQPEASTASQIPRWVDQEVVIEQMAINAPVGWKIVVKEHPRNYGSRGHDYYARLLDLPNVHLVHPSIESDKLLRACSATVTLTGSAGLEAVLLGKPVAVLGRPFYSEMPCVRPMDYPEDIWRLIGDETWMAGACDPRRKEWLAAYMQSLTWLGEVDHGRIWPDFRIAAPRLADGFKRTLEFLSRHGATPDDFDPGWDFGTYIKPPVRAAGNGNVG